MPTYEYRCKECQHLFELWQEVGADAPPCPECASEVQKVFHPIRTIYKGSGFYVTDSKTSRSTHAEAKETKPAVESSGKTDSSNASTKAPASTPAETVS